MKFLFMFLIFSLSSAFAAQMGRVIVPEAPIHEYPRADSQVIGTLKQGASQAVSNAQTEGYFKTRAQNGQIGWISGNHVQVNLPPPPQSSSASPPSQGMGYGQTPVASSGSAAGRTRGGVKTYEQVKTRILLGYGLHNLSYGGLSDSIVGTSELNYGTNFGIEIQRMISESLSWAVRAGKLTTSTNVQELSTSITSGVATTQVIKHSGIPLEVGLVLSPINSQGFRLGLAAYLGIVMGSLTTVEQKTSGETKTVEYSSIDPMAAINLQGVIGLGRAFGIFGEVGYRYHKSGTFDPTTALQTGATPALQIDYSGLHTRFGLEFRF